MKHILLYIVIGLSVLMCAVTGCSTTKNMEHHTDSVYLYREITDTVYRNSVKWDSVYVHDSVFMAINDSVTVKEIWKWRDRYSIIHDTVHVFKFLRDSANVSTNDLTIKEKQLSRWDQIKLDMGGFVFTMLGIMLLVSVITVLRKSK